MPNLFRDLKKEKIRETQRLRKPIKGAMIGLDQQERIIFAPPLIYQFMYNPNEKTDKKVWILWAEGRVHGDFEAIPTPIGNLPKYEDLKALFEGAFDDRTYTKEEYEAQFCIRVKMYLEKLDRMEEIYSEEEDMPEEFWQVLKQQRSELKDYQDKYGDVISPFELYEYA